MSHAWLTSKANEEAVEKLKEFGVNNAVHVGYSSAGNIKYMTTKGQIQVIQKKKTKKFVEILEWIRTMADNGYGETCNKPTSQKQKARDAMLRYKRSHWEDIAAMWDEVRGNCDIALFGGASEICFYFNGKVLKNEITIPLLSNSLSAADYQEDGDYSGYFRRRLENTCYRAVMSAILQVNHVQKVRGAARKNADVYTALVQEVFYNDFPNAKASIQYTRSIPQIKLDYDSNGMPQYAAYITKLRKEEYHSVRITVDLPKTGSAIMEVPVPDPCTAMYFTDGRGEKHGIDDDIKICTNHELDNTDAVNWQINNRPISINEEKKEIESRIHELAKQMKLVPEAAVRGKIQKTYERYAVKNGKTENVIQMDTEKNAGPNYEHAYNLITNTIAVPTVYGIVNSRGKMVSPTPFAAMLDAVEKPESAMAKKKKVTDDVIHEYRTRKLLDEFQLSVSTAKGSYPYIDGSAITIQVSVFGTKISVTTGPIVGRTTGCYTKHLREEMKKAYNNMGQKVGNLCAAMLQTSKDRMNNPVIPAVIEYVQMNERYVTENAVIQALRGTTIQLNSHLYRTEACGKLSYFPKDVVENVVDELIKDKVIDTKEIKGEYGWFNTLKMSKRAEEILFLYTWIKNKEREKEPGRGYETNAFAANPYRFHNFLQGIQEKAGNGEDITEDQILLLQNLGNYYFTGYYFEEITHILADHFSDGIKAYLEMTVFAAQDNASLTDDHKKLIAKIQTTVKKIVREKKKAAKEAEKAAADK